MPNVFQDARKKGLPCVNQGNKISNLNGTHTMEDQSEVQRYDKDTLNIGGIYKRTYPRFVPNRRPICCNHPASYVYDITLHKFEFRGVTYPSITFQAYECDFCGRRLKSQEPTQRWLNQQKENNGKQS